MEEVRGILHLSAVLHNIGLKIQAIIRIGIRNIGLIDIVHDFELYIL